MTISQNPVLGEFCGFEFSTKKREMIGFKLVPKSCRSMINFYTEKKLLT